MNAHAASQHEGSEPAERHGQRLKKNFSRSNGNAPCSGFTAGRGLAGAARAALALALARPLSAPPVNFFSRLLPPPPDLGFAGRAWCCCALPLV